MNNMVLVDEANLNELLGAVKYFETTAPFTASFDKGKWCMMEQKLHYAREATKQIPAQGLIKAVKKAMELLIKDSVENNPDRPPLVEVHKVLHDALRDIGEVKQ